MTFRKSRLPAIPPFIDLTELHSNLKLYSEEEIALLNQQLKHNGKYHSYLNEKGDREDLPFTVFVYNGKYFASYPGKKRGIDISNSSSLKYAQDLETGEWVCEKVLKNVDKKDVLNEAKQIKAVGLAIEVDGEAVTFEVEKTVATNSLFRRQGGMFKAHQEAAKPNRKNYLFMRYIYGRNLIQHLLSDTPMAEIVKLDIAIGVIDFLMRLHENNMLHRDLKGKHIIVDPRKKGNATATVIDFGLANMIDEIRQSAGEYVGTSGFVAPEILETAEPQYHYTAASDVYALGKALSSMWGGSESRVAAEVLPILSQMTLANPEDRIKLSYAFLDFINVRNSLTVEEREISIFILDTCAYLQAEANGTLNTLLNGLEKYAEVRLYNNAQVDQTKLLTIRQALEAKLVIVSDTVYSGDKEAVTAYLQERNGCSAGRGRIYKFTSDLIQDQQLVHDVQSSSSGSSPGYVSLDLSLSREFAAANFPEEEQNFLFSGCLGWFSCGPDMLEDPNEVISLETPNGMIECDITREQMRLF